MYNPFFSRALALVISVGGNLSLSWLFLRALLSPFEHAEFIKNTSILIFLVEFLSIHSGGMAMGLANQEKKPEERDPRIKFYAGVKAGSLVSNMNPLQTKLLLFAVYSASVLGVGLAMGNWVLPFIFFIGLIAKFFGQKSSDGTSPERFAISVILLIFLTAITTFLSPLWGIFFPFPAGVAPPGSGDYPQGLILWGVFYYFFLAVVDAAFYFKLENTIVRRPLYYILIFLLKIITFFLKRHPQAKKFGRIIDYMERAKNAGFEGFLKNVSAAPKITEPVNTQPPTDVKGY